MAARTAIALLLVLAAASHRLGAQQDTTRRDTAAVTHILRTRDGSTLIGHVVAEDSATIRFATSGGVLTIARTNVAELKAVANAEIRNGEYWYPDPNRTRLLWAPTARMLKRGEGYYQNTYLLLQNFFDGVTDRVTLGGGFTVIPSVDPTEWGYYAMPKIGVYDSGNLSIAAGAFAGISGLSSGSGSAGIVYGVGTYGPPDGSVSAGVGFGYHGSTVSNQPVLMFGGERRISRRFALISENYALGTSHDETLCGSSGICTTTTHGDLTTLVSYGVRFIGEKLSVDFAFINITSNDVSWIFPGIPYLSFAVKF